MQPRVLSIAALVALTLLTGSASATRMPIVLPPLTGSEPVGTLSLHLIDRSRPDTSAPSGHRELMVQLWYPASNKGGVAARYMPLRVATLVEREDHVAPGTISGIRVRARSGAPVAAGAHPVVLFSPGSGEMRSSDSALLEDLASHGYIVVALDHSHESEFVEFPGGRVVRGTFVDTGPASNKRALAIRVADVRFVLGQLALINRHGPLAGHLNLAETGMFGFSLGGATAAAAMLADHRIKAGADLDGSIYGRARTHGLSRTFMLMLEPRAITLDRSIVAFAHRLLGPRVLIGLRRSAHESFTDFVWVKPQLMRVAPAAARHIDVGSIGPRAVTEESAYLSAFFDRYLRRRREPLLLHASRAFPDVVPLRSGR